MAPAGMVGHGSGGSVTRISVLAPGASAGESHRLATTGTVELERGAESAAVTDAALRVFAYAVAEKSDVYTAIVDALMEAKERFQLQLRPPELARFLHGRLTVEEVGEALEALFVWGNVSRFYDPAAPETLDQFYAKRFLYQLTERGVAAHEGIRAVRRVGLDTGRLSGVLLPTIAEVLKAIEAEANADEPDPAKLYGLFVNLFSSFKELADNAARYMDTLSVEMATITADDESFLTYKRAVFAYLDEFVARLSEKVPEIAAVITVLGPQVDALIDTAARADEAPVRQGEDVGVRRSFAERWSGVEGWFQATSADDTSIADSLRLATLDAINRILAALDRLHERHLRRVSREADFTQLARWFATMDGDDAAMLWDHAFGLWRPRHFAEVAGDEEEDRNRSFWVAAPAEVAPRLRATGVRSGPGRPARAASYREAKAAGLAAVREAHRQAEEALARLAGRSPVRLSDLGRLDTHEFGALLAIVDAALAASPDGHRTRRASTALVEVTLRPLSDARVAEITTPAGRLRCADCLLDIALTRPAARGRRERRPAPAIEQGSASTSSRSGAGSSGSSPSGSASSSRCAPRAGSRSTRPGASPT